MDPTGGHQGPPRPVEDTMPEALTFDSGGVPCAAALYRPAPAGAAAPCVVMGHGFCGGCAAASRFSIGPPLWSSSS